MKTSDSFKILFVIGVMLLFTSIFLDWYSVQIFDDKNALIGNWNYNIFIEWSNHGVSENILTEWFKPANIQIPLFIHLFFIGAIIFCAYGVIFKDLENTNQIKRFLPFAYSNVVLLILNGFYSFIFPAMYLFPHSLYFPFLFYEDGALKVSIMYSVGLGYFLQLVGFILIFPHTIFYYKTILGFETSNSSPATIVKNQLQAMKEKLNLDKFIEEEEVKKKIMDLDLQREINIKQGIKPKKGRC